MSRPDLEKEPEPDIVGIHYTLATIPETPVSWLWPGRLALGKFTLLEGSLDLGKSAVALDLAARVSSDRPMPCEERELKIEDRESTSPFDPQSSILDPRPPSVLIFSVEDTHGDTLRPRLRAAGADLNRVFLMPYLVQYDHVMPVTFPDGTSALAELVAEENVRLVILDPLLAFFGRVNCYSDKDVRRALDPLVNLADKLRFALLGIRHWVKVPHQNLLYRGTGAVAISGASRTTLAITPEPGNPDQRRLSVLKSNLAAKPKDLLFTLDSAETSVHVHWLGEAPPPIAVPDLPSVFDQACELLRRELAQGPRLASELQALAGQAGIGRRTLKKARARLAVRSLFRQGRWWCNLEGK